MSPSAILNWTRARNQPWHRFFEGVAVALDGHIAEPGEVHALAALDRVLSQAFSGHSGGVGVIATGRGHCTGYRLEMRRSDGLSHTATAHAFDRGGRHTRTGWEGGASYNRFDCSELGTTYHCLSRVDPRCAVPGTGRRGKGGSGR